LNSEYHREFAKTFEMTLMLFSSDWGKGIHEKNLKQKSRAHVSLNQYLVSPSRTSNVAPFLRAKRLLDAHVT
jgi:hypothetical protein